MEFIGKMPEEIRALCSLTKCGVCGTKFASEVCANNHYGSAKHRKREAYSKKDAKLQHEKEEKVNLISEKEEWSMKEPELRRELEEARSVLQSSGGSHEQFEALQEELDKKRQECQELKVILELQAKEQEVAGTAEKELWAEVEKVMEELLSHYHLTEGKIFSTGLVHQNPGPVFDIVSLSGLIERPVEAKKYLAEMRQKVVIATSRLATMTVPSLIHERDEARRKETEIGAWNVKLVIEARAGKAELLKAKNQLTALKATQTSVINDKIPEEFLGTEPGAGLLQPAEGQARAADCLLVKDRALKSGRANKGKTEERADKIVVTTLSKATKESNAEWEKLRGMSKEDAMKEFITLAKKIDQQEKEKGSKKSTKKSTQKDVKKGVANKPGSAFSLDISTEEDVRVPKPRQSSYMAGFDALIYPDVDLTNI